jgi:hypothetical protein
LIHCQIFVEKIVEEFMEHLDDIYRIGSMKSQSVLLPSFTPVFHVLGLSRPVEHRSPKLNQNVIIFVPDIDVDGKIFRRQSFDESHLWTPRTPAMAAGISDHIWTLEELLCYRHNYQYMIGSIPTIEIMHYLQEYPVDNFRKYFSILPLKFPPFFSPRLISSRYFEISSRAGFLTFVP